MIISIKVKFNPRETIIEKTDDSKYTVYLKERPVKGKANKELIKILSKHFKSPISSIKILSGKTYSNKLIKIEKQ